MNAAQAVNFSKICGLSGKCLNDLRILAVKFLFSPHSTDFLQKKATVHGFAPLTFCISTNCYSSVPFVTYFNDISCGFKSIQ